MKRGIKIFSWSVFTLTVFILLIIIDNSYYAIPCKKPNVNISQEYGHKFITKEIVEEKLSHIGCSFENQTYKDLEVSRIEQTIAKTPGVKSVSVYKQNNGVLSLDIEQDRPIARVITKTGLVSFYINENGKIMPLSSNYVAKVPVFSGEIQNYEKKLDIKKVLSNDSLKSIHTIDDIFLIAKAIDKNELIKLQTLQIYVNKKNEFEIIPRVGKNRIMLGNSNNIEDKFYRLEKFYKTVIKPKELNNFDTISLKYNNQIVCSKR